MVRNIVRTRIEKLEILSKKSENPDFRTSRTRSLSHGSGSNSVRVRPPSSRFQRGITRGDRGYFAPKPTVGLPFWPKSGFFGSSDPHNFFSLLAKMVWAGALDASRGAASRGVGRNLCELPVWGSRTKNLRRRPFWDFGTSPLPPYGTLRPGTPAIILRASSHASVPNLVKIGR